MIARWPSVGYSSANNNRGSALPVFISNPFADLSASVPPTVMQTYVIIMTLLVVGGTFFDIIHKRSAEYFFNNWRNPRKRRRSRSAAERWRR